MIAKMSDCSVVFVGKKQNLEIQRLLSLYGKPDLMRGFAKFWAAFLQDKPHKKAYAAADFIATGESFVRVIRQNRLEYEAARKWMEEAGAKLEAEMAAKRAADEAQAALDDVPDPWLEEMHRES